MTTATMSDLDAMLTQIRQADFINGDRLMTIYTWSLRIDSTYGTDLAPDIARWIETIAGDLPPIYVPEF